MFSAGRLLRLSRTFGPSKTTARSGAGAAYAAGRQSGHGQAASPGRWAAAFGLGGGLAAGLAVLPCRRLIIPGWANRFGSIVSLLNFRSTSPIRSTVALIWSVADRLRVLTYETWEPVPPEANPMNPVATETWVRSYFEALLASAVSVASMWKSSLARIRPLVTTIRLIPIKTIVESNWCRWVASARRAAGTRVSL